MPLPLEPHALKARLAEGRELALLDVREDGEFGEGHALFAVPCPFSRLELLVVDLVPRRTVPVVLMDGGDGVGRRAAVLLETMGYTDVAVVEGGVPAWVRAGYTAFQGVNVPSKVLGELLEAARHPPTIDAATLATWRNEGRPFHLFDARPPAEYAKMRVPGARCLPNGELAHRFAAAVDDPAVPVVVTCAGRTRGILGILGLRLAGIQNPVFALENGTQGWALAGFPLERGNRAEPFPVLDAAAFAGSAARAEALARTADVPWIGLDELARLVEDATRTLYLVDVRSEPEALADPVPGAVWAPGGQLVQATDRWLGVRHARVVLVDDTGLRATLAAVWLRQLGFAPVVLPLGTEPAVRRRWPELPPRAVADLPEPVSLPPDEVAARALPILDLRPSWVARVSRPAGSRWTLRPKLGAVRGAVALLADDLGVARLVAHDLEVAGVGPVVTVAGGFEAWRSAGLPVVADGTPAPAESVDYLYFVHDRHDGNLDASRRYLAWEQGLTTQLDADERSAFSP